MKMLIQTLMTNPVVRATALAVAQEIAEVGVFAMADKAMDKIAYNIALRIHEQERKQAQATKLIETKETK